MGRKITDLDKGATARVLPPQHSFHRRDELNALVGRVVQVVDRRVDTVFVIIPEDKIHFYADESRFEVITPGVRGPRFWVISEVLGLVGTEDTQEQADALALLAAVNTARTVHVHDRLTEV